MALKFSSGSKFYVGKCYSKFPFIYFSSSSALVFSTYTFLFYVDSGYSVLYFTPYLGLATVGEFRRWKCVSCSQHWISMASKKYRDYFLLLDGNWFNSCLTVSTLFLKINRKIASFEVAKGTVQIYLNFLYFFTVVSLFQIKNETKTYQKLIIVHKYFTMFVYAILTPTIVFIVGEILFA